MSDDGQYLAALRAYYGEHRVLPSYAAIGRLVGMSSKASVAEMVGRLKRDGYLDSTPEGRLCPGTRFRDRDLVGRVRAGRPDAGEAMLDTIDLDGYLIGDRPNTVLVRVKGDSMIDAGIFEADLVVVERRCDARSGEIVVAMVDGEFTLKRLRYERGHPVLRAENRTCPVVRPLRDLEIFGVVRGLVRRYR